MRAGPEVRQRSLVNCPAFRVLLLLILLIVGLEPARNGVHCRVVGGLNARAAGEA